MGEVISVALRNGPVTSGAVSIAIAVRDDLEQLKACKAVTVASDMILFLNFSALNYFYICPVSSVDDIVAKYIYGHTHTVSVAMNDPVGCEAAFIVIRNGSVTSLAVDLSL